MALRTFLCISIFLLHLQTLFSQGLQYDINQYITPDYKLQTLIIEPGLSYDNFWRRDFESESAFLKGNLFYRLDQYNRKVDRNIAISIFGQTDNPSGPSTSLYSLFLNSDQLFYVKPKFFIEYSPRITYWNTINSTPDEDFFRLDNTVGFGFGRREIISPVWKAKYILEEIYKYQGLTSDYSEEDLVLFANKLIELQKTRIFDSRFKDIYELENISQYILDNFSLIEPNTSFYVILSDLYRFEQIRLRRSGKTFAVRYTNRYQKLGDTNVTIHTGRIVHRRGKSIGDDQQLDYEIGIVGAYTNSRLSNHESIAYLVAELSYAYLLNARTNVIFSGSYSSGYQSLGDPYLFKGSFLNLRIFGERFFSSRSILTGSIGLLSNDSNELNFNNSLNINLEYTYRLL